MTPIPFRITDWQAVPATEQPGETGMALWRTLQLGDLRLRVVEVSAGYLAGEWCRKGHILYILEGELQTLFPDGATVTLTAGMSYEVSDGLSTHKSYSRTGARLFVADGGFLAPGVPRRRPMTAHPVRKRGWSLAAALAAMAAGLASRHGAGLFSALLGKYPGDALWALMVFFGCGLLFPAASTGRIAALSLATCFGIEVLKLRQSPWWVHVRHTTAGHLVFGHAFSWQNLAAYTLGVALGGVVEWAVGRGRRAA